MTPLPPSSSRIAAETVWTRDDLAQNPHRTPDKASRVRRMFAAIAPRYDLNNRLHSFGRDQAWRRRAVELCQVNARDEVLDAACGTGDFAAAFARAGAARVVGVDFTEQMIDIARDKARRLDMPESRRPQYDVADATQLPYEDASFDIISIAFGIRNVDEPHHALREFRRVLRPEGRLVILEFSQPRRAIIRALNAVYCRHIMPITATLIARDRSGAYRYLPRSVATFADPSELARLLTESGFERVESYPFTFGVCTATLARVREV